MSSEYICPLLYGEERLVMVSDSDSMPCMPVSGSTYNRGTIPNGSWVRFLTCTPFAGDTFLFHVLLDSNDEVYIPATFLPYLIKAHRKHEKGRRGIMLRRRY